MPLPTDPHRARHHDDPAIRAATADDFAWLLALNNAYAAEVNAYTPADFAALMAIAARVRIADDAGFLLALSEATPVQGPNHAWFLAREPQFLYIDRIVIAARAQGYGLGRALYDDLAQAAGDRPLCCEVNLEPANPASLAFHARLGFAPCGEARDPRNGKRVQYLIRRHRPAR
ncbi:MAG: GNAT family N-acetyltransferase [Deltaproteobacteria bacterium]|nr:GNAT family N-acetyltransferase [Deltaproteobacteria bacterium]